jgi:hypothetical protein
MFGLVLYQLELYVQCIQQSYVKINLTKLFFEKYELIGWNESCYVDRCFSNDYYVCWSSCIGYSRSIILYNRRNIYILLILGIIDAGGSRAVWKRALDGGRIEFFK